MSLPDTEYSQPVLYLPHCVAQELVSERSVPEGGAGATRLWQSGLTFPCLIDLCQFSKKSAPEMIKLQRDGQNWPTFCVPSLLLFVSWRFQAVGPWVSVCDFTVSSAKQSVAAFCTDSVSD